MGCPGAEGGEGQRRLPADARAGARGGDRPGDGARGDDPGDGEDARRLGRPRGERARAGAGGWRMRAPRRLPCTGAPRRRATAATRIGTLIARVARGGDDPGLRQRRLRRGGRPARRAGASPAWPACSSGAACCATRGSSPRPTRSPRGLARARRDARGPRPLPARVHRPAAERGRERARRLPPRSQPDPASAVGQAFRLPVWQASSLSAQGVPPARPVAASAGSSTSSAPSAPGTPAASTAAPTSASP